VADDRDTLASLADGELRDLLRIIARSDIEELELQIAGTRLFFKRPASHEAPERDTPGEVPPTSAEGPGTESVLADRVGFFHYPDEASTHPSPGDRVAAGQVLGVIESLSVPTPIHATNPGLLEAVLVEEGQAVEYGQPLFVLRPDLEG